MNTMTDSIQWMRRHADMECDRILERIDTLKKDVASYIEHYRTDICPFKTGTAYDIDVTGKDAGHKAGYRFAGADTETDMSGRHVMLTFISPDDKEHVYRACDVAGSCSGYTDMMVRYLWHDACACQDALDDISQNIYEHITEYRK